MASGPRPVLWHLAMSHYNEKARWALDYKRIPHTRRAVMPGMHKLVAKHLGDGETTPLMTVGDKVYSDSTDIIAALEALQPDPPLYPTDPKLRAEALALEDELDTELGPALRRFAYQNILVDSDLAVTFLGIGGPPLRKKLLGALSGPLAKGIKKAFAVGDVDDERPMQIITEYAEMLERRSADTGYLVGDRFTVADLTAASLFGVAMAPDLMPHIPLPERPEALVVPNDAPGVAYIRHMFTEYRW